MIRLRLPTTAAGAVLLACAAAPAFAQGQAPAAAGPDAVRQGLPSVAPPGPAAPRFTFTPVEGGTLKLDTQTGKASLCAKGPAGFSCEAVPDSRDAYEAEIARLQQEIAALKAGKPGAAPLPGDPSELDAALDYAERFYLRLKAFIDRMRAAEGEKRL
ncbi:hypothetical protein [Xanthobacter sp. KR7-225]|uniref:hypothetical protein n=1 Tax=Xanthobacter sp. KR7-225 TaxID=3156613 RepID=UPI0032B35F42